MSPGSTVPVAAMGVGWGKQQTMCWIISRQQSFLQIILETSSLSFANVGSLKAEASLMKKRLLHFSVFQLVCENSSDWYKNVPILLHWCQSRQLSEVKTTYLLKYFLLFQLALQFLFYWIEFMKYMLMIWIRLQKRNFLPRIPQKVQTHQDTPSL